MRILVLIILFAIPYRIIAQNDDLGNQTITVYTEFSPILKDANRMLFLPAIVDTIKITPRFEYDVKNFNFKTKFLPSQIPAASIKGEPLKPLDNGLINLALGNYLSPKVEIYYNNTREKEYSVGAMGSHHSSFGTIKNVAKQKIYAGFNDNYIAAYGKKMFRSYNLLGDINFSSQQRYFYGYDPYLIIPADQFKPRDRSEMEMQRYNRFSVNFGLHNAEASNNKLDSKSDLKYQYFFAHSGDKQHKIDFKSDINKLIKNNRYGIDLGVLFNNNIPDTTSTFNQTFLNINPYFKHYTQNWQIKLGLATTGEFAKDTVIYHFYPDVMIQHNISNVLIPYASFKGYIENYDFEYSSTINPFVNRINNFGITNHAQVIDLGMKGNISQKAYFHLNANYSKIDNMAFFVNDTSLILDNKFSLEYTNVERFSGYGEIALRNIGKFDAILKGHYYYYSYIKSRELPWHMPTVDVRLIIKYNFDDNLNFGISGDFVGKRYAKLYVKPTGSTEPDGLAYYEKELKPIIDFNLFGEYKFASNFYAYLNLNNITGQKQYVWNNYMSQGFNFMAGIKYLF